MQTAERLNALMDHLGVEVAFFATQVPGDVADLAWGRPERIKGLVLCVPTRLDPRPFERVAPRLLMISGELGAPPAAKAAIASAPASSALRS